MTKEKRNLTWKLKDLPTASELADLVEQGVLKPEEAREIVLGTMESDKGKIEALEKMVEFLQGLVTDLSKKNNSPTYLPYPYEKTVYIDRTIRPYWDRIWMSTDKVLSANGLQLGSAVGGTITANSATYQDMLGSKSFTTNAGGGQMLSLSVNNGKVTS